MIWGTGQVITVFRSVLVSTYFEVQWIGVILFWKWNEPGNSYHDGVQSACCRYSAAKWRWVEGGLLVGVLSWVGEGDWSWVKEWVLLLGTMPGDKENRHEQDIQTGTACCGGLADRTSRQEQGQQNQWKDLVTGTGPADSSTPQYLQKSIHSSVGECESDPCCQVSGLSSQSFSIRGTNDKSSDIWLLLQN